MFTEARLKKPHLFDGMRMHRSISNNFCQLSIFLWMTCMKQIWVLRGDTTHCSSLTSACLNISCMSRCRPETDEFGVLACLFAGGKWVRRGPFGAVPDGRAAESECSRWWPDANLLRKSSRGGAHAAVQMVAWQVCFSLHSTSLVWGRGDSRSPGNLANGLIFTGSLLQVVMRISPTHLWLKWSDLHRVLKIWKKYSR